ncbi:DUF7919 family protein [Pyxidicoccus xibeiensis]
MYFADMSEQCQVGAGPGVRSVGWLDVAHEFPTGSVAPEYIEALKRHVRTAWAPVALAGPHFCQFCPKGVRTGAARNVWIPSAEHLFIAPEMVVHYITAHGYCPPAPFLDAVLACPDQGSPQYFERPRPFRHAFPWMTKWPPAP